MRQYSDGEIEELKKLYTEGKSKSQIAKILGRSFDSIKSKLYDLRNNKLFSLKRTTVFKPADPDIELAPTDLELFNETELKREREYIFSKFDDQRAKRILNISDLHIPFHNSNLVKEVCKVHADICVVSGDFLDLYSVSTFKKDKLIPLQRELSDGASILRILSNLYPHVVISLANHEHRLIKLLQNKFHDQPELVRVFKEASNVMGKLASPYSNIDVINNWWFKLGQCVFCHPDYYSKVRSKTAQNSYEFFTSIGEEYQAILNAHTHHYSKILYFKKLLIENPCLCHLMDYLLDGHRWNAEWYFGYSIVEIDKDGNVDFNATNPYIL